MFKKYRDRIRLLSVDYSNTDKSEINIYSAILALLLPLIFKVLEKSEDQENGEYYIRFVFFFKLPKKRM